MKLERQSKRWVVLAVMAPALPILGTVGTLIHDGVSVVNAFAIAAALAPIPALSGWIVARRLRSQAIR